MARGPHPLHYLLSHQYPLIFAFHVLRSAVSLPRWTTSYLKNTTVTLILLLQYYYTHLTASTAGYPAKPELEYQTIHGFAAAIEDGGGSGDNRNCKTRAPDYHCQHKNTRNFAGWMPFMPPNQQG